MDKSAILVTDVRKVFKAPGRAPTVALQNVSLEVMEGQFLVLLGASGCGKTTLLRLLAGLEHPTSGSVRIFGKRVEEIRHGFSLMFQSAVLLPWRTVLENVLLPAEVAGRRGDAHLERARILLEMTGIWEFAQHYPLELSGGMRQRAAICRALLLDPPVLYMDEPFGALDAITRGKLNQDIYQTWAQTGKTIVFVTHDISEAVRLGTHIAVMEPRPGRISQLIEVDIMADDYDQRVASPRFHEYVLEAENAVARAKAPT